MESEIVISKTVQLEDGVLSQVSEYFGLCCPVCEAEWRYSEADACECDVQGDFVHFTVVMS